MVLDGKSQNHAHSFPAFGNFRSRAFGSRTPGRPFAISSLYTFRTDSIWFFKVPLMLSGSTVSRSLSPFPCTVTAILEKSISLILRFMHSRSRRPHPYMVFAMRRLEPDICSNKLFISGFVRTTGNRLFLLALIASLILSIGLSNTCRNKKRIALKA